MGQLSSRPTPGALVALSVHGPGGVVDLVVPAEATLADVARAYAEEAGLAAPLPLVHRSGSPLQPGTSISGAGLASGSVVVAVDPGARPAGPRRGRHQEKAGSGPVQGSGSAVWVAASAAAAALAGGSATLSEQGDRWPVAAILLLAALLGCLPGGRFAVHRTLGAPAFAAAAAVALLWDPAPERWPALTGAAALAAAVTAALARALAEPGREAEEGLRVWMAVGVGWFGLGALGTLVGTAPAVVWSVLVLVAVLAARFVPLMAVDVPDHHLLDLERLAVTAWSARERPTGRRGRIIVPARAVVQGANRGARTLTASAAAILVVAFVGAPLLLQSADLPVDRIGARVLVGCGGATLLFAARSYRHVLARALLRTAGVWCLLLVALTLVLNAGTGEGLGGPGGLLALGAVGLAGLLLVVAVVVGRGWRSAWWSRRAEIAEALCGSVTVGSVVVAAGLFRHLWEVTG